MPSPSEPFDPWQPTADSVPAATPQPETVSLAHPEQAADTTAPLVSAPPAGAPTIPGYRITAEIARGGMGRVYAAFDETLDREVAIKTLLPGADAERFVVEAKITARLPHPAIPPVHELGTLLDGTPWLAMKLIHGQTLAKLLQSRDREGAGQEPDDSRRRLEDLPRFVQVFEQIAQAVGFAHSRGIIHRDLKPLNVMVGEFGEVQVMDWGLAKNLANPGRQSGGADLANPGRQSGGADLANPGRQSQESADNLHHTAAGTILGTPGYMAPEQARGEVVDARADVFALGSILAKILTGKPAFVGSSKLETIQKAAYADLADVLSRLDACGADSELVALAKHCLSAKAEDRPANGQVVAQEVAAYRAGVEARLRQAETERAEALVREAEQRKRRRVWVGLAASLLVGLAASAALAIWAVRAERIAASERDAREAALQAEMAARQEAADRLTQIELINNSVFDIFTDLDLRQVEAGKEPLEYVLTDRLIAAGRKLDERAIHDPLVLANLRNRLGVTLLSLGRAKEAIDFLLLAREVRTAKLGPDHPDTLASMNNLAEGYRAAGKLDLALPLYEETLKLTKAKLGADHPDTLTSMGNLAAGYRAAGQVDKALPLLEETLKLMKAKLGADHPHTLTSMGNLALGYQAAGKLDLALPLYEETLKLMKAKLGADHPDTLTSMAHLALGYRAAGKLDQALPLYEETLKLTKAKLGADHPSTLASMDHLALGYDAAGKLDLALPLYEETLKLRKAKLGADHPHTLTSMNNLAEGYRAAGKLDLALPLYEETLKLRKAKLGADHPSTLTSMNNLALGYQAAGKLDLALPLLKETLKLRKAKLGADHPHTLTSMNNLAEGYRAAGQLDQALPLLEETLKLMKAKLGADHPFTLTSMSNLGKAYCDAKQGDKAAPVLKEFVAGQRKCFPQDDPWFAGMLAQVALDLLKVEQFAAADEMLRECLAIREKKEPDAWTTFDTMSLLGGALLGRARSVSDGVERTKLLNDAEPLLLKGYEGMKAREKTPASDADRLALRQRLAEALDRLIELYTLLDKPGEIEKYRTLRAEYPMTNPNDR